MTTPRIAPLPPDDRSEWQQHLLDEVDGPTENIFTTLVRHPGLFAKWLPFGGKLLSGKLPARDRELLILRTGWNCRSEYEWAQHARLGRQAGLSDDELRRTTQDPSEGWDGFDAVLVGAADELHTEQRIGDATWAALAAGYDERQLIEVPMVVGHYHLVSFTLNSLGVQLEDGVEGFPR